MKKVSLYIPCFNSSSTIKDCLVSVLNQSYPVDEIIVVDDGSTDDTLRVVEHFPVKIVRHSSNQGVASARNSGVKHAKNKFVASLDSDCVASEEWLENLMKHFKGSVAGVGGNLIESKFKGFGNSWRNAHMNQSWGDKLLLNPDFLFGSNTVFKKSVIKKAGLYDPKFRTNFEDVNLSRILKKDYNLTYEPKAEVYHLKEDSIVSVFKRYWQWCFFTTEPPKSVLQLKRRLGHNISKTKFCMGKDLNDGNFGLLILEPFLFISLCYHDLKDYFKK